MYKRQPLVYALLMADEKWYLSVFWSLMLGLIFASGDVYKRQIIGYLPLEDSHSEIIITII